MKKRLDIQSLLEQSRKADLVWFLKSRFAKNKDLANDFIIHFASTFELNESEFDLITNRIRRMMPGRLSGMTHRKARKIKGHIQDLMEQTRDCHSRQDYRQAFIIISHVITLLDQYIDQIAEKHGFKKLQNKCYQLLDDIYCDSPAPSLKKKMSTFLLDTIRQGKAIPFHEKLNPFILILEWKTDGQPRFGKKLLHLLDEKIMEFSEYEDLWLACQVQILIQLSMEKELINVLIKHENNRAVYGTLNRYLPDQPLSKSLEECLRDQYQTIQNRPNKNMIYQILGSRGNSKIWLAEIAVQEFFNSGNIAILHNLLNDGHLTNGELVRHLKRYQKTNQEIEHFHLYAAYRHLDRTDLLKDQLLQEQDIFEILPFLGSVYPNYRDEIRKKLSDLIETYLGTHYGHPAIDYINNVMDEIIRLGHHGLHDYLILKIRRDFEHRKHFQKMMKDMVQ